MSVTLKKWRISPWIFTIKKLEQFEKMTTGPFWDGKISGNLIKSWLLTHPPEGNKYIRTI